MDQATTMCHSLANISHSDSDAIFFIDLPFHSTLSCSSIKAFIQVLEIDQISPKLRLCSGNLHRLAYDLSYFSFKLAFIRTFTDFSCELNSVAPTFLRRAVYKSPKLPTLPPSTHTYTTPATSSFHLQHEYIHPPLHNHPLGRLRRSAGGESMPRMSWRMCLWHLSAG